MFLPVLVLLKVLGVLVLVLITGGASGAAGTAGADGSGGGGAGFGLWTFCRARSGRGRGGAEQGPNQRGVDDIGIKKDDSLTVPVRLLAASMTGPEVFEVLCECVNQLIGNEWQTPIELLQVSVQWNETATVALELRKSFTGIP